VICTPYRILCGW